MSDNTQLNTMTGGDTYASDDIGGIKFPRVKMIHGADGVNAGDVSAANPFPVSLPTGSVPVSLASGALLFAPSGLSVTTPSGFTLNSPSGFASILYGSGAPLSSNNLLQVGVPSGLDARITAPSGIGLLLPSGIALQGGTGAPITIANPMPIRIATGADVGIVASGIEILPGAGLASAALRVAIATDQVAIPHTQASGARFTVEQPSGTNFQVAPASGTTFQVVNPTGWAPQVAVAVGPNPEGSKPTGSPQSFGLVAQGATGVPSGAMVRPMADTFGKQIVMPGAPLSERVQGMAGLQGTGSRTVIAAPGSGISIVVTALQAVNSSPTYSSRVVIHDGSATLHGGFAPANGGGFSPNGGMFPLFVASPNTAIQGVCLASGADVDLVVSGYKVKNP